MRWSSARPSMPSLLLAAAWAAVTLDAATAILLPAICCRTLIVAGGSMQPAINAGDAVLVRPLESRLPREGEVVVFRAARGLAPTMHRVIALTPGGAPGGETVVETRGDSNGAPDAGSVPLSELEGRVVLSVPRLGYVLLWIAQAPSRVLLVAVLLWLMLPLSPRRAADGVDVPARDRPELAKW